MTAGPLGAQEQHRLDRCLLVVKILITLCDQNMYKKFSMNGECYSDPASKFIKDNAASIQTNHCHTKVHRQPTACIRASMNNFGF